MYFVYLLESIKTGKSYTGYTPAWVNKRLEKHNNGLVQSTRAFRPWKIIYYEGYVDRTDATGREKFLKSGAGRRFLQKQVKNYLARSTRAASRVRMK